MKILLMGIFIIAVAFAVIAICKINELKNVKYCQPELLENKKILTVYYSKIGNTKSVAQNINSIVGGDIKEIELDEEYPNNIFAMSGMVRKQMKEGCLPKIKAIDISNYDVIFVGSPVWNFSISLPVKAFLKNNNFDHQTLIPFFTYSGGASKKKILNEFKAILKAKDVRRPLFMFENGIILTKEQIIKWLNSV